MDALNGGLYNWHREIDPMCRQLELGSHPVSLGVTMGTLLDQWAAQWVKDGDKLGENRSKDAANRKGAHQMLGLLAGRARKGLRDPSRVHQSLHMIDCIERAKTELGTNVQVKFVMEHLVAGMSDPRQTLMA